MTCQLFYFLSEADLLPIQLPTFWHMMVSIKGHLYKMEKERMQDKLMKYILSEEFEVRSQ